MKTFRNKNSWKAFENREGIWKDTRGDAAGQKGRSEVVSVKSLDFNSFDKGMLFKVFLEGKEQEQ